MKHYKRQSSEDTAPAATHSEVERTGGGRGTPALSSSRSRAALCPAAAATCSADLPSESRCSGSAPRCSSSWTVLQWEGSG